MNLWKEKHESGQWVEIEAMDSMSMKSDFSAMNASGIMLSSVSNKQNESQSGWAPDHNGEGDPSTGMKLCLIPVKMRCFTNSSVLSYCFSSFFFFYKQFCVIALVIISSILMVPVWIF